jgi:hypothetical protein
MTNFNNILAIHLKRFKSIEDFKNLLEDNNITTIVPEKIFGMIELGWKKVFIDKTSGYVIGYTHESSKEITLDVTFIEELNNMKSITFSQKELTVDSILEKIKDHGIASLNTREKAYLDAQYS